MVEAADAPTRWPGSASPTAGPPASPRCASWSRTATLGNVLHVDARYWCDYAADPQGPMGWRYKGAPGSGALADIGSHTAYLAEFLAGDITEVSGGRFTTAITERPVALGAVVGHGKVAVSDTYEPVENDDYAGVQRPFANGAGVIQVSRVAAGHPERARAGGVRRQGCGHLGAGAAGRVPADAQRGQRPGTQRLPPGDHRSRPPVRRRRSADGRPRRRSRPERRLRLPGPRVPGGGRRPRRGGLAAALRVVLRGRPQHGGARRGRRVRRRRRRRGRRSRPSASRRRELRGDLAR